MLEPIIATDRCVVDLCTAHTMAKLTESISVF